MAPKARKGKSSGSQSAGASSSSRFLGRRNTEEAADRSIAEHFPSAAIMATSHLQVDGQTMRERVIDERRKAKTCKGRLGASFWAGLESMYLSAGRKERFVCDQVGLDADAKLWDALKQAMATNTGVRSRSLLLTWLQTATNCNQKELVALMRFMAPLRAAQNQANLKCLGEFMRFIRRLGLDESQSELVNEMSAEFDETLVSSLAQFKKSQVDHKAWFSVYEDVAPLVLDVGDVKSIFDAGDDLDSVALQIMRVVNSSRLGHKLFSWAGPMVVGVSLRKDVEIALGGLGADIGPPQIAAFHVAIGKLADERSAGKLLQLRREIRVTYRGIGVSLVVHSWAEELNLRLAAHLKTAAVDNGDLNEFKFEKGLLPKSVSNMKVDAELLGDFIKVRLMLSTMIAKLPLTGACIVDMMTQKAQVLATVDATFCIEVAAFNQLHRDAGVSRIRDDILQVFPLATKPTTLDQCHNSLESIAAGPLFKWGSKEVQNQVSAVQEVITTMRSGTAPQLEYMKDEFMKLVASRLGFFLSATDDKGKLLVGKAAMQFRFKALKDLSASGKMTFEHLSDIHVFSWMLTAEQSKALGEYTNTLLKGVKASSKRKVASAASSDAGPKGKKNKRNDAVASSGVDDAVAKLFG